MSRSTSASSAAPSTTVNLARSLSIKSSPAPAKPSNTTLFLTNLRLLDLDFRADWPAITTQTFTTQNAQQNQKNRIRCVEWALFRLFELWDVEETREKLQPFFPPLEPLQSLNLRAALYRCLNELKKNGVLGRETVLRKTMLDECKGDKLMELLLVFSTAVLKKTIALRRHRGRKKELAARTLATASLLTVQQQSSLLPLAIAHKATLQAVLEKKETQRSRYLQFSQLLDKKAKDINERLETCQKEQQSSQASKNIDTASIKRQLRENWSGDAKWLDTMLYGDDEKSDDFFLQKPFRDIWPRIEKGGTLQGQGIHQGLLESLETRVKEQQSRVDQWQEFYDQIHKSGSSSPKSKASPSGKTIAPSICSFDAHVELQLGRSSVDAVWKSTQTSQTYQVIITEMNDDLLKVSKFRRDRAVIPTSSARRGSQHSSKSPSGRKKARSDSIPEELIVSPVKEKPAPRPAPTRQSSDKVPALRRKFDTLSTPLDSEATLIGSTKEPLLSHHTTIAPQPSLLNYKASSNENEVVPRLLPPPPTPPAPPRSPSPSPSPQISAEDLLAEQILSSIATATPSPVKKPTAPRLSLTERARMSMAHASAFKLPDPIDEESPPSSLPPLPNFPPQETQPDRRTSLAERTRQSMARVSLAPQRRDRKSIATRRQSVFPVNQFETPRKTSMVREGKEDGVGDGSATPKDYLFSQKAEYENVFKSRPKIAVSPVLSPENGVGGNWDGDGSEGLEEGEEELPMDSLIELDLGLEDEVTGDHWESSPLRGRRGVGRV